jgi:L-lactate dehydrogenase complex protein LldG
MVGAQIMNARERVLSAVTEALIDVQSTQQSQPQIYELAEGRHERSVLVARFSRELDALGGTTVVVRDLGDCSAAISSYLRERGVRSVAVQSRQLAVSIGSTLHDFEVTTAAQLDKSQLECSDCGLLEAPSLMADTGSAIVLLDNGSDRMLPYLPRTCVIVADIAMLHSTMSAAAMACIQEAAQNGSRGEALIVAGPSRTADIEKTLVLGAHGPQALAVFLIEEPT